MEAGQVIGKVVTSPAPRKGFGELFAEKKNELDHFQAKMASKIMPTFSGHDVGKYMDLAIGIDIHKTIWPPAPIFPVPHIGLVFDIMGAIMGAIASVVPPPPPPPEVPEGEEPPPQPMNLAAICSAIVHGMSPSVKVHGRWIANAGTGIQHLPAIILHLIPLVEPMASSEMFMGSSTVLADGGPCSTRFHMALSCNSIGIPPKPRLNKPPKTKISLMAPTSMLLIKTSGGNDVTVGGPPTIDLFQLAFKLALKGLGKLWKKLGKKLQNLVKRMESKYPRLFAILDKTLCRLFGEPVDAATGRVYSTNTDFTLPGPIPFEWSRTYYSDAEVPGPLGYNWHHSYNMGLYDMQNGFATIRLSDGRETVMPLLQLGEVYYNREEQLYFTHDKQGYVLTDAAKLRYRFNGAKNREGYAMLSSIETIDGFSIQFKYKANGHLKEIIDSRSQLIHVDTDNNGHILKLYTIANGVPITFIEYTYDSMGNMVQTKDALGAQKHFAYKGHLLVQLTNQTGQNFYWEYEGNGDDAKCIHTWGDGGVLEYWTEYKDGLTVTRNSLGHTTSYFYDSKKLIYKIIDANGGITHQLYNEYNEPEVVVNPEGLSQKYEYNNYGKLIKLVNENEQATTYKYDDRQNLVAINTPGGATIKWEYDAQNRLIKKELPDGNYLQYTYEGPHLKSIADARENRMLLFFDNRHQLVQLTYPNDTFQQWQYDDMGNAVRVRDVKGNITTYTFDAVGNVLTIDEPDGNQHHFTYDTSANLVHAKDDLHEVRFNYGSLGVLLSRTQNGRTVRFNYDSELQLKSIANEAGELYRFGLDGVGHVISEWGFDGLQRRYERDGAGRVTKVLRPDNKWTEYAYDGTGNIISENHSDDTGAAYKYNSDGLLVAALNEHTQIKLQRDGAGRIAKEAQGQYTISRKYDDAGNTTQITSNLGADIHLRHNHLGWLQQMQSGNWQAQWQHNSQGLEIQRELSGNISVKTRRDRFGRVKQRSIGAHNTEQARHSYHWGKGNSLHSIINELGSTSTSFEYDSWDNLVSGTYNDRNGTETIYRAPDKIGNLFKTPQQKDRQYGKGGQLLSTEKHNFYYDGEGNLVFKEFKQSQGIPDGNRKQTEKELGIKFTGSATGWRYHWAGNGMLQKVTLPWGGEVSFAYDPLGRRLAKQYKGRVTRWVWDGNVPLHEWNYEGVYPPHAFVDEKGTLQQQEEPVKNLVTWLYEDGSFVPCGKQVGEESYSIVADYLGTPTHAFDSNGIKVWERELDCYGAVRKEVGIKDFVPQLYQGQYFDKETGAVYNRFRYYNPEDGVYLVKDPIGLNGGMALYGYVHEPNMWLDPFGLAGGMNGATVTVTATSKSGVETVTKASGNGLHAEINALKDLNKIDALKDAHVVISDVVGHFPGGIDKEVQVCAKCRHDIFDELIKGEAKSITIPRKGGVPITIMSDQFEAVKKATGDVLKQFEGTKFYKKRSDASFNALEKHHH